MLNSAPAVFGCIVADLDSVIRVYYTKIVALLREPPMRLTSFNYESLKRHNVCEQQCIEVTDESNQSTEEFDQGYSRGGNWRIMFVGFTKGADLLEVGVEFIEQSMMDVMTTGEKYWKHVYHAVYATLLWRQKYDLARKRKK